MVNYNRIAQPGLLAMAGCMAYALATFEPAPLRPPPPVDGVRRAEVELPSPPRQSRSVTELSFYRNPPFRTIIELPPPPPPPKPPEIPPPALEAVMSRFHLVMPDPPRGAMLEDRSTGRLTTWRLKETRTLQWKGRALDVTLERVDANDFSVHFSAPKGQTFAFRIVPW